MDQAQVNWLTNLIWNIADDVLRGVFSISRSRASALVYQTRKLCSLAEISADILALEQETEGLLGEITGGAKQ